MCVALVFLALVAPSCSTIVNVDDVCLHGGAAVEQDKRGDYLPMNRLSQAPENAEVLKSVIVGYVGHPVNSQNQKVAWYESGKGPVLFCNFEPESLGKAYEESFSWYLLTNEGSESEVLSQGANWVYLR